MFVGYQFGHDSQQVNPDSLLISASTTVLHPLKMTGKCGLNLKYFKKKIINTLHLQRDLQGAGVAVKWESQHMQHQHPISIPVLLPTQLHNNAIEKSSAVEDGPSAWAPFKHMGEPEEALDSSLV